MPVFRVDFTLRKDKTTQPPHYIVIFKSRDADNLEQAFKEFTAKKLSREAKPSIRKALSVLREADGSVPERKERQEIPSRHGVRQRPVRCIILTVSNTYIDAGGYAHE